MTVASFPAPVPVTEDDLSPEFSDDALALEFSSRHAGDLRFCAQWGAWLHWDGARWKFEKTLKAFDMARSVAREFANACNDADLAPKIAAASKVSAIERLARADRRHATSVDHWDQDPWLLNTPGGMVDLRTGRTLPHDPLRYITKITAVAPKDDCPRWRQFLKEVTGGDSELQDFLQRIAGYALTGSVQEHALFFFYGTGGNGKGVFLNTLSAILADYAAVAPMEAFIATTGERHPTDLAGLRGARLVSSQETEEGRRWAESKIKALTGGDPITARFMRQDFFTYIPAFKLVIAGNHKPGLRGVDEAIRRRFHLVPFVVTIAKPDRSLPDKLNEEWPGILKWMIEGCLLWQREGLAAPQVVRDATDAYLGEEDAIARWVDECCRTGRSMWCSSAQLWESWKGWSELNNERTGSRKTFRRMLRQVGAHCNRHRPAAIAAAGNSVHRFRWSVETPAVDPAKGWHRIRDRRGSVASRNLPNETRSKAIGRDRLHYAGSPPAIQHPRGKGGRARFHGRVSTLPAPVLVAGTRPSKAGSNREQPL